MSNSPYRGIWMDQGFNTVITNNTIDADWRGIIADYGSYYSLDNNIIINNIKLST